MANEENLNKVEPIEEAPKAVKIDENYQMEEIDFWDGVTVGGKKIMEMEGQADIRRELMSILAARLLTSEELAKIHFNTQVYNEIGINGVDTTTRGGHSEGVAVTAGVLASKYRTLMQGDAAHEEVGISETFAEILGYMHDFGHTPFGHDGEGALNDEMERFSEKEIMDAYRASRREILGQEYTTIAGDSGATSMCYEHNETSAIIAERFILEHIDEISAILAQKGLIGEGERVELSPTALQYIKTGILAHSTSRVKPTPKGIEQQAVRLADKVAYIPQDLLDLLKQGVISIDDLADDQKALIGLGYELTQDEQAAGMSEEDKREEVDELIELLRRDDLSPAQRKDLFERLDQKVTGMQIEIAKRCVAIDEKTGKPQFVAKKEEVDRIAKTYKEHKKIDPNDLSYQDTEPVKRFRKLREAQMALEGVTDPEEYAKKLEAVKVATAEFTELLQETYGMDPLIATLWATKAEYQDSFINGEVARVTDEGREELSDINDRNEHGWQIKATFQYFYTHPDQIPQEFIDRYPDGQFTAPQRVSAFIASFTNTGLTELFQELHDRGLVVSREQAIEIVQQARPDLDVEKFAAEGVKIKVTSSHGEKLNEEKPKEEKISANDMLEVLFSEVTGKGITADGPVQMPRHQYRGNILEIARQTRFRRDAGEVLRDVPKERVGVEQQYVTSEPIEQSDNADQILQGVIGNSLGEVSSDDIIQVTEEVIRHQKEHQIDPHRKEAEGRIDEI